MAAAVMSVLRVFPSNADAVIIEDCSEGRQPFRIGLEIEEIPETRNVTH